MGFSQQEYWSGLPFPLPGELPNPGIEPALPALQADSFPTDPPGKLTRPLQLLKNNSSLAPQFSIPEPDSEACPNLAFAKVL